MTKKRNNATKSTKSCSRFPTDPNLPRFDDTNAVQRWVRSRTRPWAIDLFGGLGGLTLGLKNANFSVLYAVDANSLAVESYRENHKDVLAEWADIRDVKPAKLRQILGLERRQLDLAAGCPPCQGFSRMRTLNGHRQIEDARNDLVNNFYEFVFEFLPKAVMLENVPGLANDRRFEDLREKLSSLGYLSNFNVLNSADYGVPQRRRRLILLAALGHKPNFGKKCETVTVRDTIGSLSTPGDSGDPAHDLPEKRSDRIRELIRTIPKDGGSRADAPSRFKLPCHTRCDGFFDVYGRMKWDSVSPTITSGCINPSKGRFLHPAQDRCITLREAVMLQGFPQNYHLSLRRGKYQAAQLVGDALPPEFVRRHAEPIATWIAETHEQHSEKT